MMKYLELDTKFILENDRESFASYLSVALFIWQLILSTAFCDVAITGSLLRSEDQKPFGRNEATVQLAKSFSLRTATDGQGNFKLLVFDEQNDELVFYAEGYWSLLQQARTIKNEILSGRQVELTLYKQGREDAINTSKLQTMLDDELRIFSMCYDERIQDQIIDNLQNLKDDLVQDHLLSSRSRILEPYLKKMKVIRILTN